MNEFSWPVRVYYEDTDAGGVVYYANYMKYFERGRTEMLRSIGFEQDELKQEQGLIFAVHSLNAKYLKPAVFNDQLVVISTITKLAKASLVFSQSVLRQPDEVELCRAEVRVACLHADDYSPAVMPDNIARQIQREFG